MIFFSVRNAVFISMILISSLYSTDIVAVEKRIYIATEDFPPFSSASLPHKGFLIRIVTEAFAIEGVEAVYRFELPEVSFTMASEGTVAGTVPWTYKPERKKFFHYSDPIVPSDSRHFYFLKNRPIEWKQGLHDSMKLKGLVLGGVKSYSHGPRVEEMERKGSLTITRAISVHQNLENLFEKKVDAVICHVAVCDKILQQDFVGKRHLIDHVPIGNEKQYYHLLLNKKDQENKKLLKIFNKGLGKIKKNGTFAKIINDYLEL